MHIIKGSVVLTAHGSAHPTDLRVEDGKMVSGCRGEGWRHFHLFSASWFPTVGVDLYISEHITL